MSVNVRYIVKSVEDSISFYTQKLGFKVDFHPAPGFAALSKDNLKLYINSPGAGGAGQSMPDGAVPSPEAGIESRSRCRTWKKLSQNLNQRKLLSEMKS